MLWNYGSASPSERNDLSLYALSREPLHFGGEEMSESRTERLTKLISGAKTRVKMQLRDHEPYKTVPIEDLITDAAPIIAQFVVEAMDRAKEAK